MLKCNEKSHGFFVRRIRPVEELNGVLYELEHERSGAALLWLDREEENKTFAVCFRTIPEDDMGVFHILEHSMLCGSDRYPVREPFVELLKSSLKTFLNAFTYPDKTIYPFSSCNNQDFINLLRVYMDAVLHPSLRNTPEIFRQEGWHYELSSPEAEPVYKGVVFNEMKGASAGAAARLESEMNRLLFPDTCYRFEAGGNPERIPELTYEKALSAHERFYDPSNSCILLDGRVDVETVLRILDEEYFRFYEHRTEVFSIPLQEPVPYRESVSSYAIGEEEPETQKTVISMGYVAGSYEQKERLLAAQILCDYLAGSNEAPLKRAILEAGLGQEVMAAMTDDILQPYLTLQIWNTEEALLPKIRETVENIIRKQLEDGLDRENLKASLRRFAYEVLDQDSGWMPAGLVHVVQMAGSWLYGKDPIQNLEWKETIGRLEDSLSGDYFEKLLEELMITNPHQALVCLKPDRKLAKEQANSEAVRLSEAKAHWSEEEKQRIFEETSHQLQWQQTPDTEEALSRIPMVKLSDIPEKGQRLTMELTEWDGIKVICHQAEADGIFRMSLYFDACDLTEEELPYTALLGQLLGKLPTKNCDSRRLQTRIRQTVGSLNFHTEVYGTRRDKTSCRVFFTVDCGCLKGRREEAVALICEILRETCFQDFAVLKNIMAQIQMSMQMDVIQSGNRYAATRTAAYESAEGAAWELLGGYSRYLWQQDMGKRLETGGEEILSRLEGLAAKLFCRSRLTMSMPELSKEAAGVISMSLPEGERSAVSAAHYGPIGVSKEGIIIPAGISFAVQGTHICGLRDFHGSFYVLANVLSHEYLWNAVRVQGGAYGTGLLGTEAGSIYCYSYRDPTPGRTLNCYGEMAGYLEDFCRETPKLDKFIIGSLGDFEPLLNSWRAIKQADGDYFRKTAQEEREQIRTELLGTTVEDLRSWCEVLEAFNRKGGICVVGGEAQIKECKDKLETITALS